MTHPGHLGVIEDLERVLSAMPLNQVAMKRSKERYLKIEIDRARRAGYSAQAILDAQRRGRGLK